MPDVKRFGRSVLSGMVAQWANWLLGVGTVGLYTVWRGPLGGAGPSLETVGWGVVIVAMVLVVLFQLPSDRKRAAATNAVAPFDRTEVPRPWADDLGDRSTDEEWRQSALEEIKRQEELLSWSFKPTHVRAAIRAIGFQGFTGVRRGNETFVIELWLENWSGSPVRVAGVEGRMSIGAGAEEAMAPEVEQPGFFYIDGETRGAVVIKQRVPNFDFQSVGLWNETGACRFDLGALRLILEAQRPDETTEESRIPLSESRFVLWGPIRPDGYREPSRCERRDLVLAPSHGYSTELRPQD